MSESSRNDTSSASPLPSHPAAESELLVEVKKLIAGMSTQQGGASHRAPNGADHPHQPPVDPASAQNSMFVSALSSLPDDSNVEEIVEGRKPNVVYFTSIPIAGQHRPAAQGGSGDTTANTTLDESVVANRYREMLRQHTDRHEDSSPPRRPPPTKGTRNHSNQSVVEPTKRGSGTVRSPTSPGGGKRAKGKVSKDGGTSGELWREKAEAQGLLIDILQRDLVHQDATNKRLVEQVSHQRIEMRTAVAHHALEKEEWQKQLVELSTELSRVRRLVRVEVDAGLSEKGRRGGTPCKHSQHPSYIKVYDELQQTRGHNMALRQRIIEMEVQLREKDASTRHAIREMQLHQQCLVAGSSGAVAPEEVAAPQLPVVKAVEDEEPSPALMMALLHKVLGCKRGTLLAELRSESRPRPRAGSKDMPTTRYGVSPNAPRYGKVTHRYRSVSVGSRRPSPFRNCQ